MLLSLATKLLGSSNERTLKGLIRHVAPINALESKYEPMSDAELRAQTDVLRARLEKGETVDQVMHDAFAVVREAAKRALGQRHFDVQLIGGAALHKGMIAEMRTGEGKTLTLDARRLSQCAVRPRACMSSPSTIISPRRDSGWMGQVHRFLGLTIGVIVPNMPDFERQAAYACDITYGTNNEFGFDYLRDNMKYQLEAMVQRPFNFAVVDEVDSVLIDEARTPLIISGPAEDATEQYVSVNRIIRASAILITKSMRSCAPSC